MFALKTKLLNISKGLIRGNKKRQNKELIET